VVRIDAGATNAATFGITRLAESLVFAPIPDIRWPDLIRRYRTALEDEIERRERQQLDRFIKYETAVH